jgi:hypothetical protein
MKGKKKGGVMIGIFGFLTHAKTKKNLIFLSGEFGSSQRVLSDNSVK